MAAWIIVHKTVAEPATRLVEQCPLNGWDQGANVWWQVQHHVWKKPNRAYQHKLCIPTVKHGVGGVMIWACLQTQDLVAIGLCILESNTTPCVWQLKLGWNSVAQQDNDPKHSCKSTTEAEKEKNEGSAKSRPYWLKCCGGSCVKMNAHESQWTKAMLKRVGQNWQLHGKWLLQVNAVKGGSTPTQSCGAL